MTRFCCFRQLFVFLLLAMFAVPAIAQVTIVGYDTTNPNGAAGPPSPDLAAAENAGDVTPLLFSRGAGLTPNQGVTLNSSHWATPTLSGAIGANDYLEWGWSASTGLYNLEEMTIQYDRSDSGPTAIAILLSINGGLDQSIFTDNDVFVGDETHTIDLTMFDNVGTARFRLYGFFADSSVGTFDIERFTTDPDPARGIVVSGIALAVPEPGSILFLAGLALGIASRRRR